MLELLDWLGRLITEAAGTPPRGDAWVGDPLTYVTDRGPSQWDPSGDHAHWAMTWDVPADGRLSGRRLGIRAEARHATAPDAGPWLLEVWSTRPHPLPGTSHAELTVRADGIGRLPRNVCDRLAMITLLVLGLTDAPEGITSGGPAPVATPLPEVARVSGIRDRS
jgi:hypothetical protein